MKKRVLTLWLSEVLIKNESKIFGNLPVFELVHKVKSLKFDLILKFKKPEFITQRTRMSIKTRKGN